MIKSPHLDEIARKLLRAWQGFEIVEAVACPERWPLTAAQRLLEDAIQPSALTAASRAESPAPHCQRVRLPQSSAVKLWAEAVATFNRRATRSSCGARLARAMKSLQPWPEPRPCCIATATP